MQASSPSTVLSGAPLRQFHGAHGGILDGIAAFAELPALAAAAERARETGAATLDLFDRVVRGHHADEEEALFTSVQRSCRDAAEAQQVGDLVALLTAQHRQIESLWDRLRPAVARVAAGKATGAAPLGAEVARLVSLYREHADCEEQRFLPLADAILRRNGNHMAALEVDLHLRHAPLPRAYI